MLFAPRFLRSSALARASTRFLSTEAAPENVKLIVDQICKLNLMEVKHLNQLLRVRIVLFILLQGVEFFFFFLQGSIGYS
jgi:hypothetical protein